MVKKLCYLATIFLVVFCFFPTKVSAVDYYFSDSFTESTNTTLSSHTPDIGTSWTQLIDNGRTLEIDASNDYVTSSSDGSDVGTLYMANGSYLTADYTVTSTVTYADSDSNFTRSLAARIQDANNMYLVRYTNTNVSLYKREAGTWTLLNSRAASIGGSLVDPYHGDTVTLKVNGTTISVQVNGVNKISLTDATFSAAGKAGMGTGYINISTDDSATNIGMDDFVVTGLTDITSPTVSSLSPADGATGVTTTANLVITFNEIVSARAGANNDITLYRSSDDMMIESIDSQNAKVTGSGTDTITVNPDATLSESTDYYVHIGSDAFDDLSSNSFTGFADKTTWNFTVGNFPTSGFSNIAASATDTGATITWTTSEASSSKVDYGLTSSYGKTTSETDTSPRVTSHSVTLTGLRACRRYYYRVKSTNASSVQSVSSDQSFSTTGCSITSITSGTESSITTSSGGNFSLTNNSSQVTLTVPDGFSSNDADFQINRLHTSGIPDAPVNTSLADEDIFDLSAVDSADADLTSFDKPLTFTVTYGSNTESSFNESTLGVFRYNTTTSEWENKNCTLDTVANTLTCSLSSFSIYAVFGQTVSAGSSSYSTPSFLSGASAGTCTLPKPGGTPNLFQISPQLTSVMVYFSPILGIDTYFLSFSHDSLAEEHGALLSLGSMGVQSFKVNYLQPGTKYYFKVRGQNGCMPGDWSNSMSITTLSPSSVSDTNDDSFPTESKEENNQENVEKVTASTTEELENRMENTEATISTEKASESIFPSTTNSEHSQSLNSEKQKISSVFLSVIESGLNTGRGMLAWVQTSGGLKALISHNVFLVGENIQNFSQTLGYKIIDFGYKFIDEPTRIYNVRVVAFSPTQARISWETNHPANGKVNYGLDETYPNDIQSDMLVTEHEFVLENLQPGTRYHFEVMSHAKSYVYDANREFLTPLEEE